MRKIKGVLETGFAGCKHEEEFDFDDDVTDEEIEETVKESLFDNINWSWWEVIE